MVRSNIFLAPADPAQTPRYLPIRQCSVHHPRWETCMLSVKHLSVRALLALACLRGAAPAGAANNDPVVLVHGFLGFGPDAFPGGSFLYWGGYHNIAARMQRYKGPHAVYTAGVGAI